MNFILFSNYICHHHSSPVRFTDCDSSSKDFETSRDFSHLPDAVAPCSNSPSNSSDLVSTEIALAQATSSSGSLEGASRIAEMCGSNLFEAPLQTLVLARQLDVHLRWNALITAHGASSRHDRLKSGIRSIMYVHFATKRYSHAEAAPSQMTLSRSNFEKLPTYSKSHSSESCGRRVWKGIQTPIFYY
ncbi:unnamed protein product [Protopolystoma xenopodis]|uniref:Uncharacterized protein n=1 Tax=Protopolystoma xenopodis TaxID=117903 RepID=A0A3S5BFL0_9PLAT|nr:unnamed protein product [Protopolystoma xenopodis]